MIRILTADSDSATRKAITLLLRGQLGTNSILQIQDVQTLIRTVADASPDLLLLD